LHDAIDLAYAQVFRDEGIDVERLEPQVAAKKIRGRAVAAEVAMALDAWTELRGRLTTINRNWQPLRAVAVIADRDPLRNRLRSLFDKEFTPEFRQELTRLAGQLRAGTTPPPTLALLAHLLLGAELNEEALRTLRFAAQVYPNDLRAN